MERVTAAAAGFLGDGTAVAAATEVDRLRERVLPELTEAFVAFRDADESLQRLADRVGKHMRRTWQPAGGGAAQNLWGFRNEEESRFLERFLGAAPRLPEVDLASLLRSHLQEDPQNDEERIQLLLAFAEFVAGLDQKGDEGDRLGVGPAAHFLTFAWHCLTRGREPVFTWASDRGARALGSGGSRDWETRIRVFYQLARTVIDATPARPPTMRDGWAVEHALAWAVERAQRDADLSESAGTPRPTIVPAPRSTEPAGAPRVEPAPEPEPAGTEGRKLDRISQITKRSKRLEDDEPARPPEPSRPETPRPETQPAGAPAEEPPVRAKKKTVRMEADRLPHTGAALEDYHTAPAGPTAPEDNSGERAQLEARARKKVKVVEADRMRATGLNMDEALPRDRVTGSPPPRESKKTASGASPAVPAPAGPGSPSEPGFKTAAMLMRESRERDEGSQVGELEEEPAPIRTPVAPSPRPAATAVQTPPPGPTVTPVRPAPRWDPPEDGAVVTPIRALPRRTDTAASPRAPEPVRATTPVAPLDRERRLDESDSDAGVPLEQLVSELRGEVIQVQTGEDTPAVSPDRLARDLLLDPALTGELLAALEERGRLLLVGPPATGKTHVARRLAIHTAGHTDRILFLRVHPELHYQTLLEGGPGQPGLIRDWCEKARRDREHRWALVLDELDRGDAARCLGEMVGALVERGKGVLLASGAELVVPRNLAVIATAREEPTDPALVGRFPIVGVPADPQVLRRFLSQVRPGCEWAADLLATLHQRLAEQGHTFRVGHGLFIDPDLDPARLRRIWGREVLPLLRSHGVDTSGLDYDQIRPR